MAGQRASVPQDADIDLLLLEDPALTLANLYLDRFETEHHWTAILLALLFVHVG